MTDALSIYRQHKKGSLIGPRKQPLIARLLPAPLTNTHPLTSNHNLYLSQANGIYFRTEYGIIDHSTKIGLYSLYSYMKRMIHDSL
jgi:hypothetical protein